MEGTPGSAFSLLLTCPFGLSRSQVSVEFGPDHDRKPHPDPRLEESIDEIWRKRKEGNPSLYSGLKFRYGGHALTKPDGSSNVSSVCLDLGLTDYRTFVGTNLNPLWEEFLVHSEDDFVRCEHMSNPLGNGAILETADEKIVVLQRSHNVGEFPGYFVFPGGHSEPQEVGISSHRTNGMTVCKNLDDKVSQEMFDGIIREVVEEVGVPVSSLTDPIFIGISQRVQNVRPTSFFFLKTELASKEIHQLYTKAADGYESTQIYTVSRDGMCHMTSKMPGCHRGGFALYELMIEDLKNV